jgi:hypothetical protein
MQVPKQYYDEIFHYRGEWDVPSCCGLRIVCRGSRTVVIVTELYLDNPGSSVTSAGQSLALQICEAKGLDFHAITYIECNPNMQSKLSFYDESLYEVNFSRPQPSYRLLTKQETNEIFKP